MYSSGKHAPNVHYEEHRVSDVDASIDGVAAYATGAAHGAVQGNSVFVAWSSGRSRNRGNPALKHVPNAMVVGVCYNQCAARQYGDARRPCDLRLVLRSIAVATHAAYKGVRSTVALRATGNRERK